MSPDEQAIRNLVALWHQATADGDVDTVLTLMSADVAFLAPGMPPMHGRDTFAQGLRGLLASHGVESTFEVVELAVSGDLAYCWVNLTVRFTSKTGGPTKTRVGNALSILRKQPTGEWVIIRDANMLTLVDNEGIAK